METLQRKTILTDRLERTTWRSPESHAAPDFEAQIAGSGLDYRTVRMLAIYMKEDFKSRQSLQRSRLKLLTWVVRGKLQAHLKRAFDLLVSLISLPLFLPVMLVTAVAIKLDSPGPVFFHQERVGKWGQPFACYKFRSMYVDAEARKQSLMAQNEADEIVFKIRKDPRITRVGRVIRKLSIDELPQIFNVIKGDMSIVGPRPPVPIEVENYQYDHFYRLGAVPGITGLQQVSGRSDVTFKRWIELDLEYIQEQSLWVDIKIMLKTIPAVISGKGAY